jgi:hypothetical protein
MLGVLLQETEQLMAVTAHLQRESALRQAPWFDSTGRWNDDKQLVDISSQAELDDSLGGLIRWTLLGISCGSSPTAKHENVIFFTTPEQCFRFDFANCDQIVKEFVRRALGSPALCKVVVDAANQCPWVRELGCRNIVYIPDLADAMGLSYGETQ